MSRRTIGPVVPGKQQELKEASLDAPARKEVLGSMVRISPIGSMYGIFTYIYQMQVNIPYIIHGSYGSGLYITPINIPFIRRL